MVKRLTDTSAKGKQIPIRAGGDLFKLPKIDVPTYDGDLTKYFWFKNRFDSLVHNNPALEGNDVGKYHYLTSALVGDAAAVVSDFTLNNLGYQQAYDHFVSSYENNKAIVAAHFSRIYTIELIKNENEIREMLSRINSAVRGLSCYGVQIDDAFSRFLTFLVSMKLDKFTRRDWRNSLTSKEDYPRFDKLEDFLKNRMFGAEENAKLASAPTGKSFNSDSKTKSYQKAYATLDTSSKKNQCVLSCGENHPVFSCPRFLSVKPQERHRLVRKHQLCLICLSSRNDHKSNECESKFACKCGGRHNYLLHFEFKPKNGEDKPKVVDTTSSDKSKQTGAQELASSNSCSAMQNDKFIILPTITTRCRAGDHVTKCRVMLDSCSQPTLVSDYLVNQLKLPMKKLQRSLALKGVGEAVVNSTYTASLTLVSKYEPFELTFEAAVVPATALSYSASIVIPAHISNQLRRFPLADEAFTQTNISIPQVDVLLGAEFYKDCLCNETRKIEDLTLRLTHFGWTATGPAPPLNKAALSYSGFTTFEINENLKKFWEIEEINLINRESNRDENDKCVEHFYESFRIAKDGKFEFQLPFKTNPALVSDNYE